VHKSNKVRIKLEVADYHYKTSSDHHISFLAVKESFLLLVVRYIKISQYNIVMIMIVLVDSNIYRQ
jgi:hypothetical protein